MMPQCNSFEQIAFFLQQVRGVGSATIRSILRRIKTEGLTPDEILDLNENSLRAKFGLNSEAVSAIKNPSSSTLLSWDSLMERGVIIRLLGFKGYPSRLETVLGKTAPPIIYLLGNEKLFESRSIGFCGSRKASEKGLEVAKTCGQILAEQSINIVSGYAAGVDMATHVEAIKSGGSTIIVLPNGILHFHLKEQISTLLGNDDFLRILVVSEFPPGMPWKAHNAMIRNRTIVGLADAMIVIESGLEGGTFEAGNAALLLGVPLFCIEYATPPSSAPGNAYFLSHGAIAIRRNSNGLPNVNKVLATTYDPHNPGGNIRQPGLAFTQ
jgi:DNA protecting protein DprA